MNDTLCAIFIAFLTLAVVACEEKEDPILKAQRAKMHGQWTLSQGTRNGNATETLTGVYFTFDSTGKMQTNLPLGPETMVPCQYKLDEVIQEFSKDQKVIYQIKSVTDTTLLLSTFQRGVQLEMLMKRDSL